MLSLDTPVPPRAITLKQALARQWPILTTEQSRHVDRVAIAKHGVSGWALMQNAAAACVEQIRALIDGRRVGICVLCGPGNNGGDGYVIARDLALDGHRPVAVCVSDPNRLKGDARLAFQEAERRGVRIESWTQFQSAAFATRIRAEGDIGLVVDALLGTGAHGAPRDDVAGAIHWANEFNVGDESERMRARKFLRIAIDVPSGWDADTGHSHEPTFQADLTLTFVTPKPGMVVAVQGHGQGEHGHGSGEPLGQVRVLDIALPATAKRELGIPDHPSVEPDTHST
ncbi:MAG: NAD(P)H-hydrate epimerase [Planctomycetota bacterium]